MDETTKKIGAAFLVITAAIAAVMLSLQWAELIQAVFVSNITLEYVSGVTAQITSFMRSTSIAIIFLIFMMIVGLILSFFSKDKILRIFVLAMQGVVILAVFIFCIMANKFYYVDFKSENDIDPIAFLQITTFQSSLLTIIVTVFILLAVSAIWYISGFFKKPVTSTATENKSINFAKDHEAL